MTVQVRNAEMVNLLSADFQPRYEPNFAWKSATAAFMALPLLRAFWPMSSVAYQNPRCRSIAGSANHLTSNNSPDFGYDDLAPYVTFDGNNQYLSRPDGGAGNWADIQANEAYVVTTQRGVTFGGWFWVDTVDANAQYLIAKGDNVLATTTYLIYCPAGLTTPAFSVSNGAVLNTMVSTEAIGLTAWGFVVARYEAATPRCDVWVNGVQTTDLVGIPAAPLVDHALAFTIGASPTPALYLDGKASMCFLCACALPNAAIFSAFEQTRAMYGV